MPTYKVNIQIDGQLQFKVDAETAKEARQVVLGMTWTDHLIRELELHKSDEDWGIRSIETSVVNADGPDEVYEVLDSANHMMNLETNEPYMDEEE